MVLAPWPRTHHHWLPSAGVADIDNRPGQIGLNVSTGDPFSGDPPVGVAAMTGPVPLAAAPSDAGADVMDGATDDTSNRAGKIVPVLVLSAAISPVLAVTFCLVVVTLLPCARKTQRLSIC